MPTAVSALPRLRALLAAAEDARRYPSFARKVDKALASHTLDLTTLTAYESDLASLSAAAWAALTSDAFKRLRRTRARGWAQVFDVLNEAKGYAVLQRLGCADIAFVARSYERKSPDLTATLDGVCVLCEVKTIGTLNDEWFSPVSDQRTRLSDDFLAGKFTRTLAEAKAQLDHFAAEGASDRNSRKIVTVIFHPDTAQAGDVAVYAAQFETFLKAAPLPGVEVKVFIVPAAYGAKV